MNGNIAYLALQRVAKIQGIWAHSGYYVLLGGKLCFNPKKKLPWTYRDFSF